MTGEQAGNPLDCTHCPGVCITVARRTLAEAGIDTSSDVRSTTDIVQDLVTRNPDVRAIAQLECTLYLGQVANPNQARTDIV